MWRELRGAVGLSGTKVKPLPGGTSTSPPTLSADQIDVGQPEDLLSRGSGSETIIANIPIKR